MKHYNIWKAQHEGRGGYKGDSFLDSGYFYAPFIPLTSTPVVLEMKHYDRWKSQYYGSFGRPLSPWTMECAQDLKAMHGLDAEAELAAIMAKEILAEMDKEIISDLKTAQGC